MNINIVVTPLSEDFTDSDIKRLYSNWDDEKLCVLTIVRVGTENKPATQEELMAVAKSVQAALKDDNGRPILVTHHAVEVDQILLNEPPYDDDDEEDDENYNGG